MDFISVIMPTYNVEKEVYNMLNSIKHQTYKNFELIIVNDGSTDKTKEICEDFIKKNKELNVNLISTENSGVSAARNIGINESKGDYIVFIDSDDILDSMMLETMVNNIHGYDYIVTGYSIINDKNTNRKISDKGEINRDKILELYEKGFLNPLWNKMFLSRIVRDHNIRFDETKKIGEDLDFIVRYIKKTKRNGFYVDRVTYNYYVRNTGSNYQVRYDAAKNCLEINNIVIDSFKVRFNIDKNAVEAINLICIRSILRRYKTWLVEYNNFFKITRDFKTLKLYNMKLECSSNKRIKNMGEILKHNSFVLLMLFIIKDKMFSKVTGRKSLI